MENAWLLIWDSSNQHGFHPATVIKALSKALGFETSVFLWEEWG
jgi:hypothetical protein